MSISANCRLLKMVYGSRAVAGAGLNTVRTPFEEANFRAAMVLSNGVSAFIDEIGCSVFISMMLAWVVCI